VDPAFAFEGVVVEFDGVRVLDQVTADVPEGGVTVLLGPSGSGKSTLLRLCNRLEIPTSGRVRFRGDDVAGLDPLALRRRVGMVFQRPTLFDGTVLENLRVAAPHGDEATFAAALERGGLESRFLDRRGDDLSGGEAQRACLARTLVTDPEVLLLDEPTSALDTANRRLLEERVCELAHAGVTSLWVTHDLQQSERIADHFLGLVAGRLADEHELGHVGRGEPTDHTHD
jgi:UDP-glucose/iron transport system ATP-binding protein